MRLIDADELIKCLDYCAWNDATEVVNAQPTAYDVEKVVAELEHSIRDYTSDYHGVDYIDPEEAIEIVKRGGLE